MIQLEKFTSFDFEEVWEILEQSFPKDELRTKEKQRMLFEEENAYEVLGVRREQKICAILAVWKFEHFTYLEHFAVKQQFRNGGIGAEVLNALMKTANKIILEVELPDDEIKQRRIKFYERNGFIWNDYIYYQPPLREETKPFQLRIMSSGAVLNDMEFQKIRDILYKNVYRVSMKNMENYTCWEWSKSLL